MRSGCQAVLSLSPAVGENKEPIEDPPGLLLSACLLIFLKVQPIPGRWGEAVITGSRLKCSNEPISYSPAVSSGAEPSVAGGQELGALL